MAFTRCVSGIYRIKKRKHRSGANCLIWKEVLGNLQLERIIIEKALQDCRYNLTKTTKRLGISRGMLYKNNVKLHKSNS
ncbi:helix-turn-helix domain-containing protein [Desulfoscipio gibsoniae]|uniref:helix-turn-helix domain-containing protein n=1 Tax=Desulfoscipio gibsoniae TaxID=102134 RepID=UPI0009FD9176|nr:helix-turn-helix domain-containing protein [Desulfoscipio gibsoniae]